MSIPNFYCPSYVLLLLNNTNNVWVFVFLKSYITFIFPLMEQCERPVVFIGFILGYIRLFDYFLLPFWEGDEQKTYSGIQIFLALIYNISGINKVFIL